ncbi:transmembrane amino acid transporter protein-domain-containing protein [Absidia repens]|uniref:Transmembrane amino acid transporter protein-domain-containing protein n=1 Tax=Absidia repens TaxID=90262 RepID=A0A1X2HZV1_9FUNG|nr:transmembrane amino acid transporter protein-domain-containing protein [Absidia repens]
MTIHENTTQHPNSVHPQLTNVDRDLLQAHQPGYGSRNAVEVAFNLVNSTVGAGIIGLPFAMYLSGFYSGLALSIFVSVVSQFGLYMLVVAGQRVGIYKFAVLVEYLLGRPGYHFLNIMVLVQAAGACLSYIILIGDTLPVLLALYFPQVPKLSDRSTVLIFVSLFLIFPLNLSRSIGALARWSIVSVLCLPIILLTLLIRAPVYSPSHTAELLLVGPDIFASVAIMAFGFACSQVAFNNFLALKQQTSRMWAYAVIISALISYIMSMSFAIIGYLSFGKDVQPNLFLNFPADDAVINVGRLALGISMILTVPMAFYPAREALQKTLGFETPERQPNSYQHYGTTIVISIAITVLGLYVRSVGKVYALIGGVSATTLAYILPAASYLVTRSIRGQIHDESKDPLLLHSGQSYNSIGEGSHGNNNGNDNSSSTSNDSNSNSSSSSSSSSSRRQNANNDMIPPVPIEEEPVVIDLHDGSPCWYLDLAAGLLIIWGLIVMFFSTKGVFTQP